ncbi:hypothetical protein D3C74_434040 [compost metagenome]
MKLATKAVRSLASATSSPEVMASSLFSPSNSVSAVTSFRSRAEIRACTASSGVAKVRCAMALASQATVRASRAKPHEGAQLHFNKRFIIAYSVWVECCARHARY